MAFYFCGALLLGLWVIGYSFGSDFSNPWKNPPRFFQGLEEKFPRFGNPTSPLLFLVHISLYDIYLKFWTAVIKPGP